MIMNTNMNRMKLKILALASAIVAVVVMAVVLATASGNKAVGSDSEEFVTGSSEQEMMLRGPGGGMGGRGSGSGGGMGMGGRGSGSGGGMGMGDGTEASPATMGGGGMGGMGGEMFTIHNLLDAASAGLIERSWEKSPDDENIMITTTTSDDEDVSDWLVTHVLQMKELAESGGRIRQWDPLFRQIFDSIDEFELTSIEDIETGVRVHLTSYSDCGKALREAHVRVVDDFAARGYDAAQESHPKVENCE